MCEIGRHLAGGVWRGRSFAPYHMEGQTSAGRSAVYVAVFWELGGVCGSRLTGRVCGSRLTGGTRVACGVFDDVRSNYAGRKQGAYISSNIFAVVCRIGRMLMSHHQIELYTGTKILLSGVCAFGYDGN